MVLIDFFFIWGRRGSDHFSQWSFKGTYPHIYIYFFNFYFRKVAVERPKVNHQTDRRRRELAARRKTVDQQWKGDESQYRATRGRRGSPSPALGYRPGRRNMALIAKSKGKSLVWMYFGLKADAKGRPLNNGQCVCRLCRQIVLAKNGNTTNLRSHLKRRHRAKFSSSSAAFEIPGDHFRISNISAVSNGRWAAKHYIIVLIQPDVSL